MGALGWDFWDVPSNGRPSLILRSCISCSIADLAGGGGWSSVTGCGIGALRRGGFVCAVGGLVWSAGGGMGRFPQIEICDASRAWARMGALGRGCWDVPGGGRPRLILGSSVSCSVTRVGEWSLVSRFGLALWRGGLICVIGNEPFAGFWGRVGGRVVTCRASLLCLAAIRVARNTASEVRVMLAGGVPSEAPSLGGVGC